MLVDTDQDHLLNGLYITNQAQILLFVTSTKHNLIYLLDKYLNIPLTFL